MVGFMKYSSAIAEFLLLKGKLDAKIYLSSLFKFFLISFYFFKILGLTLLGK